MDYTDESEIKVLNLFDNLINIHDQSRRLLLVLFVEKCR